VARARGVPIYPTGNSVAFTGAVHWVQIDIDDKAKDLTT
jgi:hypothetical protein